MEQEEDGGEGAADHADGRAGQRVIEGGWGVEWARLMHRRADTITEEAMTAATAIVQRLTVATRNVGDFGQLGVELHHRFEGEAQWRQRVRGSSRLKPTRRRRGGVRG